MVCQVPPEQEYQCVTAMTQDNWRNLSKAGKRKTFQIFWWKFEQLFSCKSWEILPITVTKFATHYREPKQKRTSCKRFNDSLFWRAAPIFCCQPVQVGLTCGAKYIYYFDSEKGLAEIRTISLSLPVFPKWECWRRWPLNSAHWTALLPACWMLKRVTSQINGGYCDTQHF